MPSLTTWEVPRAASVRRQVSERVRERILSGDLKPGDRVPSSQELARRWQTDVKTIQRALTPLVREGLLDRTPGTGTFVRARDQQLTRVAIYVTEEMDAPSTSLYLRSVVLQLRRLLRTEGIEPDVWTDSRDREELGRPWSALVRAAEQRRVQAVILPATGWEQIDWASKLPVPVSMQGSAQLPNGVKGDLPQLARLSLQALNEQACDSVGIICPMNLTAKDRDGRKHDYVRMFEEFDRECERLQIALNPKWIRRPTDDLLGGSPSFERFGYEQFHALWAQPRKPRGLVVLDDVMAHGVIKALLERQIRVPEQLRLVLLKNAHIDLFCPLSASYVVYNETAVARALLDQVQKQFRGEVCQSIRIRYTLRKPNQGSGTSRSQ